MDGWLILALLAILATGVWVVDCWWNPFAHCRSCGGRGTHKSPVSRKFRNCRKCGGGGRRLRPARVVWKKISGN